MHRLPAPCLALALSAALVPPATAQEAGLSVELNDVADVAGGCQVSFLVRNATGSDLEPVVFEAVLITSWRRRRCSARATRY